MRSSTRIAALVLAALLAGAQALGQVPAPFVPNEWEFGRLDYDSQLRFCIDKADPEWPVAMEIGEAIAHALLLEPVVHEVHSRVIAQDLDELFGLMLEHCYVHMGFKLLPSAYPPWFTLTRPYYRASYVFVTKGGEDWQSLADIPISEPIATTIGTRADLRFTAYLAELPRGERWRRFPMGTNQIALQAVLDGTAAAALVWEPVLWAERQTNPDFDQLRVIGSAPLAETSEGVGAVVLAKETFLRASLDEAIAALSADGTIAEILARHDFPGHVVQ